MPEAWKRTAYASRVVCAASLGKAVRAGSGVSESKGVGRDQCKGPHELCSGGGLYSEGHWKLLGVREQVNEMVKFAL